jgi:D-hydroxyproline dehydrogenase subunit beta
VTAHRGFPGLPSLPSLPATADAVIIGAGIVGAATAACLAATGRRVCVIDRSGPLGGTTAAGEGNILVSDKLPGPELELALRSAALWREFASTEFASTELASTGFAGPGGHGFEFEPKGGVVVARDPEQLAGLRELGGRQRAAGVEVISLDEASLRDAEPHLAPGLAGGAFYPQDSQVQPMRAAMAYLARAGGPGVTRAEAVRLERAPGSPGLRLVTNRGRVTAPVVVNAAGPWGGEVARRLGSDLPVRPRRGHILVTEPLPPLVRHKVYECDYLGTVVTDSGALACSAVVEGTASGTVLVGSSRDFGGNLPGSPGMPGEPALPDASVLAEIARRAIALFPFLGRVRVIRAYTGFRPACADHLPVIGQDPSVPGLYHATGHEGAGIGLAPATAELLAAIIDGTATAVDPAPFSPARFTPPSTEAGAAGPGTGGQR